MNYLRGSLSAAYQYYRDLPPINASTLTGAIDVIVIQRKDENGQLDLACTPFHVRFGKWQILRPSEKKVNVQVNGRAIPFNMKIGEAGEAFFVFETEEDVPEDLMTSPILQATSPPQATGGATQHVGRFGAKDSETDGMDEDAKDAVGQGEEQDIKNAQEDAIPEPDFLDLDAREVPQHSKDSEFTVQGMDITAPSTSAPLQPTALEDDTRNSSKLLGKSVTRAGDLGKTTARAVQEGKHVADLRDDLSAAEQTITTRLRRSSSVNDSTSKAIHHGEGVPPKDERKDPNPPVAYLEDVVVDMAGYHSKEQSGKTVTGREEMINRILFEGDMPTSAAENAQALLIAQRQKRKGSIDVTPDPTDDVTPTSSRAQSPTLSATTPGTSINIPLSVRATSEPPELDLNLVSGPPSMNNSLPQYSWEWGGFPVQTPLKTSFSHPAYPFEEHQRSSMERAASMPPSGEHVHSPEIPEGERSGVANEDGEDMDIHFGRGGKLSSVGEYGYMLEFKGRTTRFELSTCGDVSEKPQEEAESLFKKDRIRYRDFIDNPGLHRDELCIMWRGRCISRKQSSPLLAALVVWRQATLGSIIVQSDEEPLSSSDERDDRDERPQPSKALAVQSTQSQGRWSRWFGRSRSGRETPATASTPGDGPGTPRGLEPTRSVPSGIESAPLARTPSPEMTGPAQPMSSTNTSGPEKHYVKTLRLTSDQLKELNLKKGPNSITFSISATGVATCTARIFVWDAADQIVISDIDGTITKSDALGHVFTMIGRDWTHLGVAKLYTDICRNGYKIMYLTSRAIGQADSTRDYLRGINQNNYQLPEGPVIMSPDRLMASLHREVIMRQPEVFKMACLRDIQRLFGPIHRNPFYAGFGNRITDALSYRSVNVPSGRIFTIDSSGEVKMELLELAGYKSSYIHMTDLVDQMFPPIHRKWAPEFTDANFWRQPIAEFDFPDFRPVSPQPSGTPAPPSPALSARSDASIQTGLSRLRNFSLRGGRAQPEFVPAGTTTTKTNGNGTANGIAGGAQKVHQRAKSSMGGQDRAPNTAGHFRHTSAGGANGVAIPRGQRDDAAEKAMNRLSGGSMPGSYDGFRLDDDYEEDEDEEENDEDEDGDEEEDDETDEEENGDEEEDDVEDHPDEEHEEFDELLATGAMDDIPYI